MTTPPRRSLASPSDPDPPLVDDLSYSYEGVFTRS